MTQIKPGLTDEHRAFVELLQHGVRSCGKSQRGLAIVCHMSVATVNHALSGARLPSRSVFESLIRGLGADPDKEPWKSSYEKAEGSYAKTGTRRGKRSRTKRVLLWTAGTLCFLLVATASAAYVLLRHLENNIGRAGPAGDGRCAPQCWPSDTARQEPKGLAGVRLEQRGAYLYDKPLDTEPDAILDPGRLVLVYCFRPGPEMSLRVLIKFDGKYWYTDPQALQIEELRDSELNACVPR